MQQTTEPKPIRSCSPCLRVALLLLVPACDSQMPSARLQNDIRLPVPNIVQAAPSAERLTRVERGEVVRLSPLSLIGIAFSLQPDIKSSFQRFKQEEARYDFFYVSRDSLTPRLRTSNRFAESRTVDSVVRDREHVVEFAVEKRFFDTTELDVGVGLRTGAIDQAIGYHPFISASLRYPLWVSRERLERTSEEIFRRNELNDAQLDYIQGVRGLLQSTLFRFYNVVELRRRLENTTRWRDDLEQLRGMLDSIAGRDLTTDRRRIDAEHARLNARVRELDGRFEIDIERLKAVCGLPFYTRIELVDEPFNPFEGMTHEELLRISIETDPEIATLRNEQKNAEVQLDLARRGRWDVTLLLDGTSSLEGAGEDEGISDWSAAFGLDISVVDARVTDSLSRQAEANIARFAQAIISRENDIFVDTLEPIIRIETLSASRAELIENLPRFQTDYQTGLDAYKGGTLNIDDLLKRRENLFDQEQEITRLAFMVGANVAELCTATGKFFELLKKPDGG